MSYMTGEAPSAVKKRDLVADLNAVTARQSFGGAVVSFIDQVLK